MAAVGKAIVLGSVISLELAMCFFCLGKFVRVVMCGIVDLVADGRRSK